MEEKIRAEREGSILERTLINLLIMALIPGPQMDPHFRFEFDPGLRSGHVLDTPPVESGIFPHELAQMQDTGAQMELQVQAQRLEELAERAAYRSLLAF